MKNTQTSSVLVSNSCNGKRICVQNSLPYHALYPLLQWFQSRLAPLLSLGEAGRGEARRGRDVGGRWPITTLLLHYYCNHDFESLIATTLPSEVGEMNEFSVGGNHTHLSTYSTTTAPSAPPTCHLFSVDKCGCFCWEEQNVEGMHAQRQLRSPSVTRSSRRNSSFPLWRSQMATLCVFFPSFPFRVGRVLDFVDNPRFRFFESSRTRQLSSLAVFL